MSRYFELLDQVEHEPDTLLPVKSTPQKVIFDGRQPSPASRSPEAEWWRAWEALRKYWRLAATFAAVVMTTVILFTMLTKPVYEPVARVEIDPPGAELFNLEGRESADSSPEFLETQARNMESPELLVTVMRQLQLDQSPEFQHRSVASRIIGTLLNGIGRLSIGSWKPSQSPSPADLPPGLQVLNPGQASTLDAMQARLSVKRDTASHLVNVSFSSHDPVLSASVTNAIVRGFIDRTYETRHAAIMQSTEWLSHQLDDIRAKMEQSNRALAQFQTTSGIADVDQNKNTFSEQMAELSRQKTQAGAERIQIESFLRRVRDGNSESLPQVQSNLVIQQLTQKLDETRAELSQTLAVYGKNHPNAKKLQNQVDELNSQLRLQRSAIVAQMETSYSAALTREQMISSQMRGTARELNQMAQYTQLKKESEANAGLYNSLYAKVKEAGIAAASKSTNIRIVDQARILNSPTRPRPLTNLAIGMLVSIIGGILIVFGRQAMDMRVHTAEDVLSSTGIRTISMVPLAGSNGQATLSFRTALGLSNGPSQREPVKFLLEQPDSEQSEAIRGLHTAVRLSHPDHPPHVVLVASSLPAEGKTTVAINLSMAFAQQGATCMLEADLRRACVGQAFRMENAQGLSDYLSGSAQLQTVLRPAPGVAGLTIITAGDTVPDPARLIGSEKMRLLILALRKQFNFVVIDTPPILPYADGRLLAPFVDGVVFVGRAGMVTRDAMARSLELLEQVHGAPVLEVVLNGADRKTGSYGYGYGYSYSYNKKPS